MGSWNASPTPAGRVEKHASDSPAAISACFNLTPAMVAEARLRLRWLGYVAIAASLFFFTVGRVANPAGPPDTQTARWVYGSLLTLVLGGALLSLFAQWIRVPSFLVLRYAIFYQYVGAFAMQALRLCDESHQMMYADTAYDMLLPWIVLFGFSIPARANIAFPVSLITATMAPLAYAVFLQQGAVESMSLGGWVIRFVPVYVTAAVTAVLSVNFYSLGRRLESARMIGSYKLTDLIGRGGMGEVWRAEHRLLSRCSAIKLVKPDIVGEGSDGSRGSHTALMRFEREAQATAALRSPHSIEIYDFGITQDGNFYYVMELLDGMDLDTLVKRFGPQPAARVISFLMQICDSLSEAHALGLIHRDVKPKNIFVCRLGANYDFIKVLDFGLVKNTAGRQDQSLTQEGTTAGTPTYLAPEVARGSKDVDGRSDLYSVGCVAYWLLTGQTVFEGATAVATMLKHVTEAPVPPSQRTSNPIPGDLEAIVIRCLEKDPAARPQHAEELLTLLSECQDAACWGRVPAQDWWKTHMEHSDDSQPDSCSVSTPVPGTDTASDSRAATMG